MNKNKYKVPISNDLHIGLEYESKECCINKDEKTSSYQWVKHTIDKNTSFSILNKLIDRKQIRIKMMKNKFAKLKINYHNQFGNYIVGTILEMNDKNTFYLSKDRKLNLNKDYVENNSDIFEIIEIEPENEFNFEGLEIGTELRGELLNDWVVFYNHISRLKNRYDGKVSDFGKDEHGNSVFKANGSWYKLEGFESFRNDWNILQIAKEKYPKGTIFKEYNSVYESDSEFRWNKDKCFLLTNGGIVYSKIGDKWAEIIEDNKFKILSFKDIDEEGNDTNTFTLNQMFEMMRDGIIIYSVSNQNNEIFTIGDITNCGEIKEFFHNSKENRIEVQTFKNNSYNTVDLNILSFVENNNISEEQEKSYFEHLLNGNSEYKSIIESKLISCENCSFDFCLDKGNACKSFKEDINKTKLIKQKENMENISNENEFDWELITLNAI